ncbi:CRM-domain containing factor CFM9, mitochondrial [Linum perenne]
MLASKILRSNCFRTLSAFHLSNPSRSLKDASSTDKSIPVGTVKEACPFQPPFNSHPFGGWHRGMSTSKGRSMRSKVERRMRKESGKTMREIRRAKKLKKKLMTDEERLIHNLKKAKKKVALLLQKLKKYELPELPPSLHDPELFTPEQLQAFKKIGFKNKNYVPVGVRGVFGGVVQNMHMHWKFHETVQVCCDNFPKEKIKEMATMIARLSGGIVVNIHNVKTIIMFRGRNYRQPKNLIPFNTLTKRKALFKARFEQALESQKLNIKKTEQQLRRMGVNPEDPVAMASIQRVASTFFNAIDSKEGSPYVFKGDDISLAEPANDTEHSEPTSDSDQDELDRFISEIEDAADQEWAAEEAAEQEEFGRIRYLNKADFGGRIRRSDTYANNEAYDDDIRQRRRWPDAQNGLRSSSKDDDGDISDEDGAWDGGDDSEDADDSDDTSDHGRSRPLERKQERSSPHFNNDRFNRRAAITERESHIEKASESEDMLSDLDNTMWDSDDEDKSRAAKKEPSHSFKSSSSEEEDEESEGDDDREVGQKPRIVRNARSNQGRLRSAIRYGEADSRYSPSEEDVLSDEEVPMWSSDSEDDLRKLGFSNKDENEDDEKQGSKRVKTAKEVDETWDSD